MAAKKKTKETNYLELTPYVNYEHEQKDDGLINVLVPKFTNKILATILMPRLRSPYIRANLDEFGSAVWILIDSRTKVDKLSDILLEQFGERIQPVEHRLTMFLTQLYNAGFINFLEFKKGKD
jgi:hypothetical protein